MTCLAASDAFTNVLFTCSCCFSGLCYESKAGSAAYGAESGILWHLGLCLSEYNILFSVYLVSMSKQFHFITSHLTLHLTESDTEKLMFMPRQ